MTAVKVAGLFAAGAWGVCMAAFAAVLALAMVLDRDEQSQARSAHSWERIGDEWAHDTGCACGWYGPDAGRPTSVRGVIL